MTTQLATREAQNLVRRMITRQGTEHWMDEEDVLYEIADHLGIDTGEVDIDTLEHINQLLEQAVVTVRFPNHHRYNRSPR